MSDDTSDAGQAYWDAIEPIWKSISIHDGPSVFLEQFKAVRPQLRHLFAAHWCQSEVCNGGFHQFFRNSTGVLAPEAAEGFRSIGLTDCMETIERAMRFFGSSYPREEELRTQMLARFAEEHPEQWNPFSELDRQFYSQLDWPKNRFALAADSYAKRHADSR